MFTPCIILLLILITVLVSCTIKILNKLLFQMWSIVDYVQLYSLKETCVLFCVLHSVLVYFFFLYFFLYIFQLRFCLKFSVLILTATFIKNIGLITKLYPFYMHGS